MLIFQDYFTGAGDNPEIAPVMFGEATVKNVC